MSFTPVPFWKKIPFLRLLLPLIAGILSQWELQFGSTILILVIVFCTCFVLFFPRFSIFFRYRTSYLNGSIIVILFVSLGAFLTRKQDIRHQDRWFKNLQKPTDAIILTLDEPLVEKPRSMKAKCHISSLLRDGNIIPVVGTALAYFSKDSCPPALGYGSRIIIKKPLQLIRNSGNPGGFDYSRYSLFQGTLHQVFLASH
ncbi:MAG TPA: DUF4131 domain-containing protein, partial [Chryseolinea sp.]|nr:DUF4131 domain-containing protein [Chryseolinea sp.]